MRKYILISVFVLLTIICFLLITFGLKIGPFKIYSYSEIEKTNGERKALLLELEEKNISEYESNKKLLSQSVKNYKLKKEEYDSLVENGKITEENNIYNSNMYDIDFLWTTIGNYATQNGVTLQFDVSKSSTSASISSEYVICNLNFTVTGDYIPVTNFIYSIEDDETLRFEISDFVMEKGGDNLQSTFVVKNIPINSKNLSSIPANSVNIDTNN